MIKSHEKISGKSQKPVKSLDWVIIKWMLIMRLVIVTATLGVPILIFYVFRLVPIGIFDEYPIAVIVFGTYLLTILYWFAHRLSGIHRPLLLIQIAFDIFIITAIIHYTGGKNSSFVGFYLLSILCASLFFRKLVTFLFTTQSVIFYVSYVLLSLYFFGPYSESVVIPDDVKYNVALQTFMYIVVMYVVCFISSSYAERIIRKDTALISALKLLKEARLDTSDILQSMTNGLITVNMTGYIVYINRAAEKILQIKYGTAPGRKYSDVLGKRTGEMVEVVDKELASGLKISEKEIQILDRNYHTVPLGLTAIPLYDIDRSRRGCIIYFKDLTEKKKLFEMIRQSDRMAAIGELSSAIAHEIRNPLASISNAAELLKESYNDDESSVTKMIDVIEKESERLQKISTDFLKFARIQDPEIRRLNLQNTIETILLLINNDPRNNENITIRNTVDENVYVLFDEDHLKQLIINIIINSLDSLNGNGEIVFTCETTMQFDDRFARLIIYDNGAGFPDESLGHMFEPFFSTKKDGTGLGLALVRKLAVSNHGRVLARNREECGAEIALDIPLDRVE